MKRNMKRNQRGVDRDNIALIKAAIESDNSTYEKIAKATGISTYKIKEYFVKDRDLYALYKVRRRMLVELAADNIQAIVEDKYHPQHFSASKYVLQNYKSDLDSVLDLKDEEIELGLTEGGDSGIVIRFGKKKNSEIDDD